MPEPATFVIVGGGLAAAKACEALRDEGFDGRIVLIGREEHLPYERPPLSKGYLQGDSGRDEMVVHDRDWYDRNAVELRLGAEVTAIDPGGRTVTLAGGERIGYDKLLLATGARPRRLAVPGADGPTVRYLRTVDDSERLRDTLAAAARIAIIGGGWIGLEVAAAARAAGAEVTVIESESAPLLRVLGPRIADVFTKLHREHGVEFAFGARVAEITAAGVLLADGTRVDADAVVVGVGAVPDTGLAEAAGLAVGDGIEVGADLRTSDPDIFAAGDVAGAYHPLLERRVRVEHWANALNQPAVAARGMLGRPGGYENLPYFYTDQYDLGMEYVGHIPPGEDPDVVVRGDLDAREFIAFWLVADRVVAAMNVNVWDVTDDTQALIRSASPVDRDRLADPGTPLDRLV
ncbi:Anthranilate 1,2-dioxygenase system ferredoxin--NAD(+) reductase component [Actinomadura rubteroloni]|uniref:Anthranilate 1,2-dioxygenase system ferredoxin--NAD(+) reductase component n=1 Tax=Actinomadura rubteroloni TaxID=1926885 RepID=A0A2P4UEL8_9ACTN|nr:FAD-dependent oxidoreductase [Actinomadura rubteroloni]POM23514.1 Anthranilate 1,2-dioxygenase system ferredoxin--NAD(+) reductase component [Actinomadura rubteroloni]